MLVTSKVLYLATSSVCPTFGLVAGRSSIRDLPLAVRRELDGKIATDSYGTLDKLAAWLASENQPVSRSALGRYVLSKQRQLAFSIRDADVDELLDMQDAIAGRLRSLRDRFKPPALPE